MSTEQPQTEALYKISLSIRKRECLADTAREAVAAYVEHLGCSLGVVFEYTGSGQVPYNSVGAVPDTSHELASYEAARERLARWQDQPDAERDSLPLSGTAGSEPYWLFDLPEFGVILLAGGNLTDATASALTDLNQNLAAACRAARETERLRGERDRLGVIFDTIQEPIITANYVDGEPIIQRANDRFLDVFGYDEPTVLGANVNDLTVPDDETTWTEADGIDAQLDNGEPITREIRRKAADGMRDFLLRAAPVDPGGVEEYVGIYVDITENKIRQRRFEWLYTEAQAILGSTDTEMICEHTLDAAHELVDFARGAVYLYDRETEGLVPAVTAEHDGGDHAWVPYTEQGSIAWEVYRSGPRWFEDLSNCELTVPCGDTEGSSLSVPLGEHGVLMMATEQPGLFDETDFQVTKLLGVIVEVALDRAQREHGLEAVQSITRRILDAEDHEEAARGVLERLPETLDMPLSAIWQYDATTDVLEPIATTDAALELIDEMPVFADGDSIAWRAFKDGETKLVGDVLAHEDVYNDDTAFNSEIVMPLGEFGVLTTASTRRGSFTEAERRLLETLAGNVETAMRLVSRRHERDLLDQVIARVLRHNLRNDLNVIQGHARELPDTPEVAPHAQAIIEHCSDLQKTAQNARRMREIVDSSGDMTAISLPEAVDHALRRVTDSFPDTDITVDIAATPAVVAHPALPTAIEQLLENSVEHATVPPAEVCVTVRVYEDDGCAVVELTDNGPGIPQDELDILAQHGESALEHGSGAGLWMVDRVVEYSNATIEFNTDDGTTVRLRFDPA
ncbi:GAF domain-containing protein [Halovenus halobia]|uniref:GAF domain-containing protein n=1 Tax=Halovenus halobia TaxID=3396622 RepID=UPI003F56CD28